MGNTSNDYMELKKSVEAARSKAEKAAGSLEAAQKQLTKFGCNSIKSAEAKLENLREEKQKAQNDFEKSLKSFQQKWDKIE